MNKARLNAAERKELMKTLEARFNAHVARHKDLKWKDVESRIEGNNSALVSLYAMEQSGGEPDVTGREGKSGAFIFSDCSAESPAGRRSTCFDRAAWEARKENRPGTSAMEMAESMGVELMTEEQYRELQKLGEFDLKTSSWVQTPASVRKLGGAQFCDRRYGKVFLYHNGAQSYYASRGWRGVLKV